MQRNTNLRGCVVRPSALPEGRKYSLQLRPPAARGIREGWGEISSTDRPNPSALQHGVWRCERQRDDGFDVSAFVRCLHYECCEIIRGGFSPSRGVCRRRG